MKTVSTAFLMATVASAAFAQQINEPVVRSSSPSGVKIQEAGAPPGAMNALSGAAGTSERSTGQEPAVQAGSGTAVQIQGNTRIKASVRNLNSSAVGVNNAARNEVGAIGK